MSSGNSGMSSHRIHRMRAKHFCLGQDSGDTLMPRTRIGRQIHALTAVRLHASDGQASIHARAVRHKKFSGTVTERETLAQTDTPRRSVHRYDGDRKSSDGAHRDYEQATDVYCYFQIRPNTSRGVEFLIAFLPVHDLAMQIYGASAKSRPRITRHNPPLRLTSHVTSLRRLSLKNSS